jgi:hypothetical protein
MGKILYEIFVEHATQMSFPIAAIFMAVRELFIVWRRKHGKQQENTI